MRRQRSLLDYAYVLVKWRRFIVVSVLSVSLAAAGISLILPKRWTATAVLLPPEEGSDQVNVTMLLEANMPTNLQRLAGAGPGGRLLSILGSRRVLGAVVDSLRLVDEFGASSRGYAIYLLDKNVERKVEREGGALIIDATASRPELAAAVANALAGELDEVNRQCQSLQARELREFLEDRVKLTGEELTAASQAVREFEDAHGVVNLDAQTAATVEVVQSVLQELIQLEVKLGMSQRVLEPEHEERARLEFEVAETRRQLEMLVGRAQTAAAADAVDDLRSLGPALVDIPGLAHTFGRLFMDVQVKHRIMSFLTSRLEEARYQEALDTPTLLVLDPAVPPETRSAPRRKLIVLVAWLTSLVVSTTLAFIFESWTQLSAENQSRLDEIGALLRRPS